MGNQVYFEDVQEGTEVPTLRKDPTTQQLVKYAGASGDYYQIHYDLNYARGQRAAGCHTARRAEGCVAGAGHDRLDWGRGHAEVTDDAVSGMDVPGTPMLGKGVVTKKYTENGENLVDCDIWLEDHEGKKTTPGAATVALPSRG